MKIELTLRSALEFALETEALGARFYQELARQFSDEAAICAIFSDLAQEEANHQQRFERLAALVPEEGPAEARDERLTALQALSAAELFIHEDGLCGALDAIKTPRDALRRAHEFERGTLAYYLELRSVLGRSEVLDAVVEEEQRHINQLAEQLRREPTC